MKYYVVRKDHWRGPGGKIRYRCWSGPWDTRKTASRIAKAAIAKHEGLELFLQKATLEPLIVRMGEPNPNYRSLMRIGEIEPISGTAP